MRLLSQQESIQIREWALEIKEIHGRLRDGNPRWSELDFISANAIPSLTHAATIEDARQIFFAARDDLTRVAKAGADERDREAAKLRATVDGRRIDELRRQTLIAWGERVSAPTRAATCTLKDRLDRAAERIGAIGTEAELREIFSDIAAALTSMKSTLDLEVRASVTRESRRQPPRRLKGIS